MIRNHEIIRSYLREVCSHVRSKEVHREIKHELESHLEELVLEREKEGVARDEAVLWAIQQMGNPTEVGNGLHSVHRPRIHWGLLIGVMAFLIIGIFAMVAVEGAMSGQRGGNIQYVKYKILAVSIGLILMVMFYFFNYLKIRSYSYALYVVIFLGMLLTVLLGNQMNGTSYLHFIFFSIDWFGISPYLLMVAAPGMMMGWKKHKQFWALTTITFLIIPMFFFLSFSATGNFMLYMAGYFLLLLIMTRSWWGIFMQGTVLTIFMFLGILQRSYIMDNLVAFFNADKDPLGSGYVYRVLEASIRSAGWWGHGLEGEMLQSIPYIPTDNIIAFLIYSYGWWIGIVILLSIVYFVGRLFQSNRAVREPYGQYVGAGVVGILSFQMIYGLLMPLGLAPLISIPFPFLSGGGSHVIIEMAMMGLIMGIYRRKDLVMSSGREYPINPWSGK